MNEDDNLDRFVKDPRLLVDLCVKVIDKIAPGLEEAKVKEKETQLLEISRTIERLEKAGVAVPEALRGEKTRLAADLGIKTETFQALNHLVEVFEEMLKDLKARLRRNVNLAVGEKSQRKRSYTPKTDKKILKEHIIIALRKFGGRAKVTEVIEDVGRQLEGKLLPGDLEWRESANMYVWQHNVEWGRYEMAQEGTLRKDSPRGIWELSDNGK